LLVLSVLLLLGCVSPSSRTSNSRDYAVTTWEASPQELELARKRARQYLARNHGAAAGVSLLAVEVGSVYPGEVQNLWAKLSHSQTSTSAYAQRRGQTFTLWCIVLVDRSTQLPLTSHGYLLANTPAQGAIAQIGGHRALYIGAGSGIF
jgi:hypothetical protein